MGQWLYHEAGGAVYPSAMLDFCGRNKLAQSAYPRVVRAAPGPVRPRDGSGRALHLSRDARDGGARSGSGSGPRRSSRAREARKRGTRGAGEAAARCLRASDHGAPDGGALAMLPRVRAGRSGRRSAYRPGQYGAADGSRRRRDGPCTGPRDGEDQRLGAQEPGAGSDAFGSMATTTRKRLRRMAGEGLEDVHHERPTLRGPLRRVLAPQDRSGPARTCARFLVERSTDEVAGWPPFAEDGDARFAGG